jgi:DNA polymerase-3 subunit gamma/tau
MNYKVLSRKYRPQKFNEIIGQPHIVDTLINSISSNRLAHGYLFSGLRGVGKTTTARVLSKTLNCSDKANDYPCEKCQNCIEITESRSLDVIELDGASNRGIDEIREIKETVKYPPISSDYKIFIIDEVHMLTKEAFNALLKTLEEPPKNVVFILATTDSHKIPDTILSRTLRFDFKKITNKVLSEHMANILDKENIKYEEIALNTIAFKADGSVRDSLSILDRIISYSDQFVSYDLVKDSLGIIEDKVYLELLDFIINSNQSSLLIKIKEVIDLGYSIDNFISGFNTFLSNCLICVSGYNKKDFINNETIEWINQNKSRVSSIDIMRIIEQVQEYELKSKYLLQPNIALESLFLKLSVMGESVKISDLLANIPSNDINSDLKVDQKEIGNIKNLDIVEQKTDSKSQANENSDLKIEKKHDNIKSSVSDNQDTLTLDRTEDFKKQWVQIIKVIDSHDKRISNSLYDAEVYVKDQTVIIDLGETDNSYIQKTLNDNQDLIQKCIFDTMNHKFNIEIKAEIKNEEDEKEHPLLSEVKIKFSGENSI